MHWVANKIKSNQIDNEKQPEEETKGKNTEKMKKGRE